MRSTPDWVLRIFTHKNSAIRSLTLRSSPHRVRITVALMIVAEHRLRFLDVTGPG